MQKKYRDVLPKQLLFAVQRILPNRSNALFRLQDTELLMTMAVINVMEDMINIFDQFVRK